MCKRIKTKQPKCAERKKALRRVVVSKSPIILDKLVVRITVATKQRINAFERVKQLESDNF